jgi:hypothetical protein
MITSIGNNEKADKHKRAMEWVKNNIPEGQLIFNADWDDFPKMFYYDQKHAYVSGLDPTYLYSRNPDLSRLFDDITNGKHDDPALIIREKFGAHYIFSEIKRHPDMYAKAMESGWVEKIYEDDEDYVLKIRDERGEPPQEAGADNGSEPTADEIKAAEEEDNDNNLAEPDDNAPEDNKNEQ